MTETTPCVLCVQKNSNKKQYVMDLVACELQTRNS